MIMTNLLRLHHNAALPVKQERPTAQISYNTTMKTHFWIGLVALIAAIAVFVVYVLMF
jgi:hypothetical protein